MGASVSTMPCDQVSTAGISCSEALVERLTARKDERHCEAELARQDEYWRERLREEDDTFACRRGLSLGAFQRVAQRTESLYTSAAFSPACQMESLRQQIRTCYLDHEGSTLMCADLVAAFNKCVDAAKPREPDPSET